LDGKSRNIRYIGELVKFSVAPPIMAFRIFNKLFLEFANQNVLLCATLLETCGRFLYLFPYTHDRIEAILDTVLRLRRAKNLDSNCQMALEAAYFTVKPPGRKELRNKKVLSPLQQYIRHLFAKLSFSPGVVDKTIRELRKLPWSTPEENVEHHVIKACLRAVKTKYVDVPLAADAIAGLARYHPKLQSNLLDTITEEFFRGMDAPHKREPQRLLGLARFLGECYNFSMINSTIIFDFLYFFLNYGHELPPSAPRSLGSIPALEALVAALSLSAKGSEGASAI
jgi:regulator of nonsense transcripts 2